MIEVVGKTILFDMDGTLVDSTSCVEGIWRDWAFVHGIDLETLLDASHGRRTIDTIRDVAPQLDAERETALIEAQEHSTRDGIVAISGARPLLRSLAPARWAVVTSASRSLAQLRLAAADLPIPLVLISAEDVALGKPSPEGYLLAARTLGSQPGDCVVFEDTPAGIIAGRAAGMHVVALLTTYSADRLLGAVCISSYDDVVFTLRANDGVVLELPKNSG